MPKINIRIQADPEHVVTVPVKIVRRPTTTSSGSTTMTSSTDVACSLTETVGDIKAKLQYTGSMKFFGNELPDRLTGSFLVTMFANYLVFLAMEHALHPDEPQDEDSSSSDVEPERHGNGS